MALFWRIFTAVSVINLLILFIFVGLATLQFDAIHERLIGERLVVLAGRAAEPFESAARLGLPVASVRNAVGVLERMRQTDDAILAIHVFDPLGRIVHSTEKGAPARIPDQAHAARREAGGASWHVVTTVGLLGGVEILGRENKSVGGIVIVYPTTQNETRVWAMGSELMMAGIAIVLVGAGLSVPILRLGLRRQFSAFESIERAIMDFERDAWRTAASGARLDPGDGAGDVHSLLAGAEERYRETGRAISAARPRA